LADHVVEIVRFLLMAIRPPAFLTGDRRARLQEAVISESIPDHLVDAVLAVATETNGPVAIDEMILDVYTRTPDMLLPRVTTRNLLAFLTHDKFGGELRDQLLAVICEKERDEVIKFFEAQPVEIRRRLRPHIQVEAKAAVAKKSQNYDVILVLGKSQEELAVIIERERKRGAKGNFRLLLEAMAELKMDNIHVQLRVARMFLRYLGEIPAEIVRANRVGLEKVCETVLNFPQVFAVLEDRVIHPKTVSGLMHYVWHCPMDILNSAVSYYPRLYALFQELGSDGRFDVVRIAVAIEKVSGESILAVPGITKPHRNAILALISQFEVIA
jgi:hypothetical protein